MTFHLTNTGHKISNDSVLAFLEEHAIDSHTYLIKSGLLIYNDINMKIRSVDLDSIPEVESTPLLNSNEPKPFSTRKHVRHRQQGLTERRTSCSGELKKKVEELSANCMLYKWTYTQLVDEICYLLEDPIHVKKDD